MHSKASHQHRSLHIVQMKVSCAMLHDNDSKPCAFISGDGRRDVQLNILHCVPVLASGRIDTGLRQAVSASTPSGLPEFCSSFLISFQPLAGTGRKTAHELFGHFQKLCLTPRMSSVCKCNCSRFVACSLTDAEDPSLPGAAGQDKMHHHSPALCHDESSRASVAAAAAY